jgi:dTDP-4-dehydrorhamnose 3,5-epimerase
MKVIKTPISGLFELKMDVFADHRGQFQRLYCQETLDKIPDHKPIRQINHSITRKCGAIRGLHFQNPPDAEIKIIKCLRGKVFDVAVDLRKNSATFLHYHALELSPESNNLFYLPEGFAHGFQTLTEDCELLYMHTADYTPGSEGGLYYNDRALAIRWPLEIQEISTRDRNHPRINTHFSGIEL